MADPDGCAQPDGIVYYCSGIAGQIGFLCIGNEQCRLFLGGFLYGLYQLLVGLDNH